MQNMKKNKEQTKKSEHQKFQMCLNFYMARSAITHAWQLSYGYLITQSACVNKKTILSNLKQKNSTTSKTKPGICMHIT